MRACDTTYGLRLLLDTPQTSSNNELQFVYLVIQRADLTMGKFTTHFLAPVVYNTYSYKVVEL